MAASKENAPTSEKNETTSQKNESTSDMNAWEHERLRVVKPNLILSSDEPPEDIRKEIAAGLKRIHPQNRLKMISDLPIGECPEWYVSSLF
jgi:hypothetical protein